MSLTFGAPPPELARELEQVRVRAKALVAALDVVNIPLPEEFPKADMLALAAQMIELPDGTGQGCLQALEYADTRFSEIRSQHVVTKASAPPLRGDHSPALTRDEGIDRELSLLIADVATARRVANRIAATEPEERLPEPSVARQSVPGLAEAEAKGQRAFDELVAARREFDAGGLPVSEPAENFRRTITDAKVAVGLSQVELAQPKIIPAWVKRFGGWLADTPSRFEQAARVLESCVDVAGTFHGGWRKFKKNVTDAIYATLREFSGDLKALGERERERRKTSKPSEPFSIGRMREMLVAGEPVPEAWVGFVDELDLKGERLPDLTPLANLTSLRRLSVWGSFTDLTPLQGLTGLQELNLAFTAVEDVTPLRVLTSIQSLNLSHTQVIDVTPLRELTRIQSLNLSYTRVADVTPLQALTSIKSLDLSHTQVSDITAVQQLIDLNNLDFSWTRVVDASPLRALSGLQRLDLSWSPVADISPLCAMRSLEILDLAHTKIEEITPLDALLALQRLNISHTKVADITPLRLLRGLTDLNLSYTPVMDITPLQAHTYLQRLRLSHTKVAELTTLRTLMGLQSLDLGFLPVADLKPLRALANLESLDLTYTQVSDLRPLSELTALLKLEVRGTKIRDTSALAHLVRLEILGP